MDLSWVKIMSWHAVRPPMHVPGLYVTLCGRLAKGELVDVAPWNEKGCETCTRIIARKADSG